MFVPTIDHVIVKKKSRNTDDEVFIEVIRLVKVNLIMKNITNHCLIHNLQIMLR